MSANQTRFKSVSNQFTMQQSGELLVIIHLHGRRHHHRHHHNHKNLTRLSQRDKQINSTERDHRFAPGCKKKKNVQYTLASKKVS